TPDLPELSVTAGDATEGDPGDANTVTFTLSLSGDITQAVTVDYRTLPGTATEGVDYLARSGSLTFTSSEPTQTVTVPVVGDLLNEGDESFVLSLAALQNATYAPGAASPHATIEGDDPLPAVTMLPASTPEGDAGETPLNFTVRLSQASGQAVTVWYQTADGTARADEDYQPAHGSVVIPAGETEAQVAVP